MRLSLPSRIHAAVTPVALPLRRPLATAHGPIAERCGFVLTLQGDAGEVGIADCLPLPGFGLEPVDGAGEALATGLLALHDGPRDLCGALDRIAEALPRAPAARAALDVALHDLAARAAGVPVAALWGGGAPGVDVSAIVGAAAPEDAAWESKRLARAGYRTLKLKLGALPFDEDLARARAVRGAVGDGVALRFDANQAWSHDLARDALVELAALDPEWVEEPLRDPTPEALAQLRRATPVRIAADESLRSERDAGALLAARAADVWVLKPAALGGLRDAWHIAQRAAEADVGVVVTSFLDAAPGLAAALHLAAALPPGPAAGIATDALLRADVADLPPIARGRRGVPPGPGLGIPLRPERIASLRRGPTREVAL